MVEACYHNRTYLLPSCYNELSGKQLIKIAPLLAKKEDPAVIQLAVLRILLKMNRISFFFMPLDPKERLVQLTEWIYEKNSLTSQLLPKYKGFFGPKTSFDNITLAEYHCTEIYYSMLVNDKKEEALDALIAVLYRKAKNWYNHRLDPDGDCRKPFNENEIEYWASKIKHWPTPVKQAILLWYDGCRESLISLYPEVFRPAPNTDDTGSEKGMFQVMRGLAEGGKYGAFNDVKHLNLHTALMEMEQLVKEAEEMKKTMPTT